ncbi:MAG TPA: DUF992 domain-containing protein [Xanthobacteraceae bacterium]|nr:DUF992 domain-containing protein [Xanthobacteraceae bacterium]
MIRRTSLAVAAAAALALSAGAAAAQSRVEVGTLDCQVAPSVSFIVGSVRELRCVFLPNRGSRPHHYRGIVRRVGVDIGASAGGRLVWAVYAPTYNINRKDLVGNYGGASAGIAAGAGVGANALWGGSRNTIALQPISVEGSLGVGIAAGVAGLELR